jgi:hypothetical protein
MQAMNKILTNIEISKVQGRMLATILQKNM